MPEFKSFPRQFVPEDFDASDFSQLEPIYQHLIDRPLNSSADLEQWLADFSELTAVVDEYSNRTYIAKSCHTEDEEIEKRFNYFVEEIDPQIKPLHFALQQRFMDSPHRKGLTGERLMQLIKAWDVEVNLYREQNIPLETQAEKINSEYDKMCGAMSVTFRGQEYTIQQMGRFLEETDRETREQAWKAISDRRLQDRDKAGELFDKLLKIRQQIASNAGFDNYRDYQFKRMKRFDYTPADCDAFADAVEQFVVPAVRKMDIDRVRALGLQTLRPWDLTVDPKSRKPLRPFDQADIAGFVAKTKQIFDAVSPQLGDEFDLLRKRNNLDLESRKAKQPGGYQATLEEAREPFIFMNAAGLQRDVETLLHEGGHAFHSMAAREEPLIFLRHAPMEFCEVASMSMELLGMDHFGVFYDNDADAARAKRLQLEGNLNVLPWIATIDQFQHWIYTHPNHTQAERTEHWLSLMDRFGHDVDWSGFDDAKETRWQAQLHLYHVPFYYIEYGIAQLGALQVWLNSKKDRAAALKAYRHGLSFGGTKPLPELFEAANIKFDFGESTIRPLMDEVAKELASLPQ